jgi:phenylalanine-4-hydroxylase
LKAFENITIRCILEPRSKYCCVDLPQSYSLYRLKMIRQISLAVATRFGGIRRNLSVKNPEFVRMLATSSSYQASSILTLTGNKQQRMTFTFEKWKSFSTMMKASDEVENESFQGAASNQEKLTSGTNQDYLLENDCDSDPPRTSLLMELTDRVGVLHDVLRFFWKYDVNICRIESRPSTGTVANPKFDFFVDMEGSVEDDNGNIQQLLQALQVSPFVDKLIIIDDKRNVHWFPRHVSEIDLIANRVLDAGQDLEADHPGFLDPLYRSRRAELAKYALEHTMDKPIANISYNPNEISVWTAVWDKMETLWDSYACTEYLQALQQMKLHCGYDRTNIPQQYDISRYLKEKTGFRMRPVAGLLSSRDFLNALAFRVFCSTQYIRHSSHPLYTPEPDIVHELLGHAPMLADPDFADFSQQIGLASIGATDEEIAKLARVSKDL